MEISCDVKEELGVLSDGKNYDKRVVKISWNNKPITLDVRNYDKQNEAYRKGISLTDEEASELTNILLQNDYGDMDILKSSLERRERRYTIKKEDLECFDVKTKVV